MKRIKKPEDYESITDEEITNWISGGIFSSPEKIRNAYLREILTGEYDLKEAREDILSFRK